MVIDSTFEWGDDRPPRIPWGQTVIYECHVKGLTVQHPGIPREIQGKFLGLASELVIDHLLSLGVTAVELLPVHQHTINQALAERGLTNYWGYSTIGFFAPDIRFATGGPGRQVTEFKSMVKSLHQAGLEIILDVVYNHTGEEGHLGPTLSFRGIDNAAYYRLHPDNPRFYEDFTGCGNSLNTMEPRTTQLVMDSLRYWVQEMHVDGFRFDLAPTLARGRDGYDTASQFFSMIRQDPILSEIKLIAEPWGPSAREAIKPAIFQANGANGTGSTVIPSGGFGEGMRDSYRTWPTVSQGAAISMPRPVGDPGHPSTSSLVMTDFRCPT